jgi:hypothetical protein
VSQFREFAYPDSGRVWIRSEPGPRLVGFGLSWVLWELVYFMFFVAGPEDVDPKPMAP